MTNIPASWLKDAPGASCPSCLHRTGRPIFYGMPDFSQPWWHDVDLHVAGCVVTNLSPAYRCSHCGREFGITRQFGTRFPPIEVPVDDLKAAACWFPTTDTAPGDPLASSFKRRARLHQARWRESQGHPMGTQPTVPKPGSGSKPVGSRLEWSFAQSSEANLLSPAARRAAHERLAHPEPHQTLDPQRLWADVLSSMPMCWNLFGPLAVDADLAGSAATAWFPDAAGSPAPGPSGSPVAVHLEWSPGRCDPNFLDNRTAFDAAVEVDRSDGTRGVIGIETKYHEHAKPEAVPSDQRMQRYREVHDRSGVFEPGAVERIVGTDLQQLWLDHLLALSMVQHPSGTWTWARYVLVHPDRNPSFARAADRYRELLADDSTFEVRTLESFVGDNSPLPDELRVPFVERYLF